ncbi:MAG: ribonuclease P [Candidatus Thermoplasmatota archaeon]|nr:ribonuclease P [Candidatus Thermoplasmatota archaeon]
MTKKTINKKNQKQIALKRIQGLFELASNKATDDNFELADRYTHIARKISMKYLVPIPNEYKRCFCKHCYCYLLPDVNSRFRIKNGKIIIFCKNCKKYTRIPFKNKK